MAVNYLKWSASMPTISKVLPLGWYLVQLVILQYYYGSHTCSIWGSLITLVKNAPIFWHFLTKFALKVVIFKKNSIVSGPIWYWLKIQPLGMTVNGGKHNSLPEFFLSGHLWMTKSIGGPYIYHIQLRGEAFGPSFCLYRALWLVTYFINPMNWHICIVWLWFISLEVPNLDFKTILPPKRNDAPPLPNGSKVTNSFPIDDHTNIWTNLTLNPCRECTHILHHYYLAYELSFYHIGDRGTSRKSFYINKSCHRGVRNHVHHTPLAHEYTSAWPKHNQRKQQLVDISKLPNNNVGMSSNEIELKV